MDYKNNLENQRNLLEECLNDINVVVSAMIGIKTELEIVENKDYGGNIAYGLEDKRNVRECCGIMAHAFKEVYIDNFGMWWNETGVIFDMHFSYVHIDGGSNGAKFCTIGIENGFVKVIK